MMCSSRKNCCAPGSGKALREKIEQQGAKAVIPGRRNSSQGNVDLDKGLYRYRHRGENTFARLPSPPVLTSSREITKALSPCAFLWLPM